MSLFEKRAEERKKADRELTEKAYSALAASVGHNRGNWEFQTEPEEQKRDSAVTDCLEFLKVQPGSVPEGVEEDVLEEDGGGATSCAMTSGANTISMPLFGVMRRNSKQ